MPFFQTKMAGSADLQDFWYDSASQRAACLVADLRRNLVAKAKLNRASTMLLRTWRVVPIVAVFAGFGIMSAIAHKVLLFTLTAIGVALTYYLVVGVLHQLNDAARKHAVECLQATCQMVDVTSVVWSELDVALRELDTPQCPNLKAVVSDSEHEALAAPHIRAYLQALLQRLSGDDYCKMFGSYSAANAADDVVVEYATRAARAIAKTLASGTRQELPSS